MPAPKLAALKGPVQMVAAASSSGGPVTRSKSQTFTSDETSKSFDVFGKEINASDHVTAIGKLMKKKQEIQEEKRGLQKELRAAQRRRNRLKRKARELSQEDLVAVLLMREQEDASKRSKAETVEAPDLEKPEQTQAEKSEAGPEAVPEESQEDSPSG